jgi:hypothetical protein
MIEVTNITTDPFQRHVITTERGPITLLLRFYPRAQFWTLSVDYLGTVRNGLKLSMGTLHMRSANFPFDFIVTDNGATGIDPFTVEDFASGRCRLLMLEREDMEEIRGQPVPI